MTYEKLLQEGGHSFGARLLVGAGCSLYGRKPTSRNRSLTQKLDASSTPCWQRLADASLRRWRTPGSGCESRPRDRVWVQRPLMRWRLSEQVLEWRRWLPWRTGAYMDLRLENGSVEPAPSLLSSSNNASRFRGVLCAENLMAGPRCLSKWACSNLRSCSP